MNILVISLVTLLSICTAKSWVVESSLMPPVPKTVKRYRSVEQVKGATLLVRGIKPLGNLVKSLSITNIELSWNNLGIDNHYYVRVSPVLPATTWFNVTNTTATRVILPIILPTQFYQVLASNSVQKVSVSLEWNPSPTSNVVGYNIYYGSASATYTNAVNAGSGTNITVMNLICGVTYYFAATAYDSFGLESDFSGEISYEPPLFPLILQIRGVK